MFLHSSFLAFTLLSLLSTQDFDIDLYIREREISEKRVKTTVSPEKIKTYGVEISVEKSVKEGSARERRVERRERRERWARPTGETGGVGGGLGTTPKGFS